MQPFDLKRKNRPTPKRNNALYTLKKLPRLHIGAAVILSLCLGVFSLIPSEPTQAKKQTQSIAIPALAIAAVDAPDVVEPLLGDELPLVDSSTLTETVKSGDNLSLIFKRAGLNDRDVYELTHAENGKRLASLYPGHQLHFSLDNDGKLQQLTYIKDKLNSFSFSRKDQGYVYSEQIRKPDVIFATRAATITESLFLAGKDAQLDDKLLMELANIFGWDIDFVLDIRKGDAFKVLFEEAFLDGEKIGNGNILAAEFVNRGQPYRAVRYEDKNGNSQYYTPTGETMRKEFLRTPIDFARISSHFNLSRKHPVLNKIRAHKGTDYAAPRGTPIKAAGDGKVVYAGRKNGYGNVVIVQHGQTYKTLYAHISKFRKGIRTGKRVKQGQVIAYVGSTGLATGPHLHYEFHVNGVVRNPVTVKLPKAQSVPKADLQRFYQHTQPLLAELNPQAPATKIAGNDTHSGTKNL